MNKKNLVAALEAASSITTNEGQLSLVHLKSFPGKIVVSGTNLEQTIRVSVEDDKAVEGFDLYVNGKAITTAVKNAPGDDINIEAKENRLSIKGSTQKGKGYSIQFQTGEMLEFLKENINYVSMNNFLKFSSKVDYAVADGDARYVFNGLCVESRDGLLHLVATDGRRMSVWKDSSCPGMVELIKDSSIIIPGVSIQKISKYLNEDEISVCLDNKMMYLKSGQYELALKLIDGQFPDWRNVIPNVSKEYIRIDLDRNQFLGTVKRAAGIYNLKAMGRMILSCKGKELSVSLEGSDAGDFQEELEIKNDQSFNFRVSLNPVYTIDVSSIGNDDITMLVKTPETPVLFQYDDIKEFSGVIMPMKL